MARSANSGNPSYTKSAVGAACSAAVYAEVRTPQPTYHLGLAPDTGMPWLQAAVLVCMQARTLRDPVLLADPLFAVSSAALHVRLDGMAGLCCMWLQARACVFQMQGRTSSGEA